MPTPIESRTLRACGSAFLAGLLLFPVGCGEPSARELKNRQEFEALLTAVSLKNKKELDNDARRIDERHKAGELSDDGFSDLQAIIKMAQAGDWAGAEKRAYEFREQRPYFK